VPTPGTGSTSVLRQLMALEHSSDFLKDGEIPYDGKKRHPRLSAMGVRGKVVISVRHPVDRYLYFKRWGVKVRQMHKIQERANPEKMIPAPIMHMLIRGYDYLIDVEGVEVDLMRFETLGTEDCDFKRMFGEELGRSNSTRKSESNPALSYRELHLIEYLNPFEWKLYNCDDEFGKP